MPRATTNPGLMHKQFCRNLKLIRESKGLTQQKVADRLGCSRAYVADIERGRFDATTGLIERCAAAVDVPYELIVDRRTERKILKNRLTGRS